ncbi:MAG: hypothetical protein IJN86_03955 [Clostridia bacterium]|nr:hypothetical protein [Clostridia bacterium]
MKRILISLLALTLCVALVSCTSDLQEIKRTDYTLDKGGQVDGYDCAYGMEELMNILSGIYDYDGDIVEMGKDVVDPIVDFDDALLFKGEQYSLPVRIYYYLMAGLKTSGYIGTDYNTLLGDEEFWDSLYPDLAINFKDHSMKYGMQVCKDMVASMHAYKDFGYTPTNNDAVSFESVLSVFGSVDALNEFYAAYGMNDTLLKEYFKLNNIYMGLKDYLVGLSGEYYPNEEECKEYYYDECVYMHQIVFSYVYTNPDRYVLYKDEETIESLRKQGKELYAKIVDNPAMFERNQHLTQEADWEQNVQGYFYTPTEIQEELYDAYKKLMPGEITAIDTPIGYYIIKAVDKTDTSYHMNEDRVITSYCEKIYSDLISPYYDKFTLDTVQYERYSFDEILLLK